MSTVDSISPHIKTFAIICAGNPMGEGRLPMEEITIRTKGLERDLAGMQCRYCTLQGRFGGTPVKFCLVFNIGLDDAKYMGHRYDQEAFILAQVVSGQTAIFRYYRKKYAARTMSQRRWVRPCPPVADYQLKVSRREHIIFAPEMSEEHAGVIGKIQYVLPLAGFRQFGDLLESRCASYDDYRERLETRIRLGIDGGGARKRMEYRASIYGCNYHRFWDVPRKQALESERENRRGAECGTIYGGMRG